MANELDLQKEKLVSVIENHDLGELIKPLVKDIHLFDSYVAGTSYLEDKTVLHKIKVGDELRLTREDNKFDENAILLQTQDRIKIGYVPEKDNLIFARLMDAGKMLKAKVKSIDLSKSFAKIAISIYLVDF